MLAFIGGIHELAAVQQGVGGGFGAGAPHLHSLFNLETNSWLLDYFQVHIWLVELHFAAGTDAAEETRLRSHIKEFAELYHMPFFERVAGGIGTV